MNYCGSCTKCCEIIPVTELQKPANTPCAHCQGKCTIHKDRPKTCADFQCLWLQGSMGDSKVLRPDSLGIMFTYSTTTPFANKILVAQEVIPGATQTDAGLDILEGLAEDTLILVKVGEKSYLMGPRELTNEAMRRAQK